MTNGDRIRSMTDEQLAHFLLQDDNTCEYVKISNYEDCFTITTEKLFYLPYKRQLKDSKKTVIRWLKENEKINQGAE